MQHLTVIYLQLFYVTMSYQSQQLRRHLISIFSLLKHCYMGVQPRHFFHWHRLEILNTFELFFWNTFFLHFVLRFGVFYFFFFCFCFFEKCFATDFRAINILLIITGNRTNFWHFLIWNNLFWNKNIFANVIMNEYNECINSNFDLFWHLPKCAEKRGICIAMAT